MMIIENSMHINTLFMTWQSNQDRRERYLVGTLRRSNDGFEFSYLADTTDYDNAIEQGFLGYPAFPLDKGPFTNNVMATFMKRLPPRSRRDFKQYLANHCLPSDFDGSDFDLIVHTGIQLPSDGFNLIPNLEEATVPFDYVMEVAGARYYMTYEEVMSIEPGTPVRLVCEDDNEHHCDAIALKISDKKIGYVNKLFCSTFRSLIEKDIRCTVAKVSGANDRPLIYVMISVK